MKSRIGFASEVFCVLALQVVFVLSGCGDESADPSGDGGTSTGPDSTVTDATLVDTGVPGLGGESYTLEWGPVMVDPSQEDTRCVLKRVPASAPIRVGQIINQLGGFSHHMIVYRTNDQEERPEPFPCEPFADTLDPTRGSPLAVTQRAAETITLPQGVAYTLEANQMIRIEMHFINTSAESAEVRASTTFGTVPEMDFEHEADFLFIGNIDIDLDPRASDTVGPSYLTLPSQLEGVNFFSITGHTHQWGTDVTVSVAANESDLGEPVYDVPGWDWDEPETVYPDPPFQVPSGGGFRFACDYENLGDEQVGFGESANDEMCFFWAYYYPSQGSQVCFVSDTLGATACCPGSPLCDAIL